MRRNLTKCKIYNDGSHYIALPYKHDPDLQEEVSDLSTYSQASFFDEPTEASTNKKKRVKYSDYSEIDDSDGVQAKVYHARYLFEVNYQYAMTLTKAKRFDFYYEVLQEIYPDRERCDRFVQNQLNRKFSNFIYRKLRMMRKVNLLNFDYFCTFTYDGSKLSEEDFRKKLSYFLQNKAKRDNWKYIGVWERSPEKNRLHFHCLLKADEATIPGQFTKKRVWSSKVKRMKSVLENDHLRKRFGVNDFSPIDYEDPEDYMSCINYLLKYIEKSGEKIVYSRGLYQYLVSNIEEDDVMNVRYDPCVKLVLFDDFNCYDDNGELIGSCSKETLSKLKKTNT